MTDNEIRMTDPDRLAAEFEFLEAALGEIEYLRRMHPVPLGLDELPRFVAMVERYGSRMVDPTGPVHGLHPAEAWMLDPASSEYIAPPTEEPADG